jgi:hypothetical protein
MGTVDAVVAAGAGLVGTLFGIGASELRWRRERRAVPADEYQKRRREAYAALWQAVEDAYLEARSSIEHFDQTRVIQLTFRVNSFLLRNAPYLDEDDRAWVDDYLSAAFQLVAAVQREGGPEERHIVQISTEFPPDFGERVASGAMALKTLEAAGDYLRSRVRREVGGEPPPERSKYRYHSDKITPFGDQIVDDFPIESDE